MNRQEYWCPFLLLAVAIGLAYFNAFQGAFQFDDYNVVVNDARIHSWQAWFASMPGIRPLLKASYTLNWTSGLGLFGFHLFNLAVHAVNSMLVYWLARQFFEQISPLPENEGRNAALFAALLFALHPVQTEAVTYISGRSSSLSASFYLASLLTYAQGRRSASLRLIRFASPVLFLFALAVKETAITLPLALLLWESVRCERMSVRNILAAQWLHWLTMVCALLAMLFHPVYLDLLAFSLDLRPLGANLSAAVRGLAYLLAQLFFPHHLNIDPDIATQTTWNIELIAMAGLLTFLLATGFASLRRIPWLAFGVLWFFLQLLPTHTLVPRLDIANERQLYLAAIGPIFALSAIGFRLSARWNAIPLRTATLLMCAVLALATHFRNRDYRDEVSLWEATAALSPGKARVFNNLGFAYEQAERKEAARSAYLRALAIDPRQTRAAENLAALK
ncbi:MAG: tetratricopeptide repeat protein [Sulfuricella sp.]